MSQVQSPFPVLDNNHIISFRILDDLFLMKKSVGMSTDNQINIDCTGCQELRAMLPGLQNGRHEVIICGLFWLKSLLEKLRVETFKISTAGLRFAR